MVSSFINVHKLQRKSASSFHEENNRIAQFFRVVNVFSILNLDTLEYRRLSCDLTLYHKIFYNLAPWSPSEYFNVSQPPHSLNSVYHDYHIRKPMCRSNSFENNFFNRCVSAWNNLPRYIVKSNTVTSFKRNLRFIDLSSFLKYVS